MTVPSDAGLVGLVHISHLLEADDHHLAGGVLVLVVCLDGELRSLRLRLNTASGKDEEDDVFEQAVGTSFIRVS